MPLRDLLRPLCFLFLSFPLVASSPNLISRSAAVNITSPKTGDTVVAGSDFNIQWQNSTDNNVTLSLRQGTADNMTLVHVISASTYNNGSYAWRSHDDDYLEGKYKSLYGAPDSNCNYALEFRTAGEVINSDFFTILNQEDGGISANSSCSGGNIADYVPSGSSSSQSSSSNSTGSSTDNAGGISSATLGGAVGGTVAGMILLFGILFFVARKMGWIMSKYDCEVLMESRFRSEESRMFLAQAPFDKGISPVEGGQIHQMP